LGAWVAANEELEKLPAELRGHREVLRLRCRIYEKAERWNDLGTVAEGCFNQKAEDAEFLMHMGWPDYKMNNTFGGHRLMLAYSDLYGTDADYSYRLACPSAALGKLDEARVSLAAPFKDQVSQRS
jgi:hypothetical protein